VMSAVQARIHYAMKQEFKLLAGIIRDYTPDDYSYEQVEGNRKAKQSDYDMVEVIPVSDPNAATMSQKVVQYQAVMQMAQANPQIYDLVELNKQMLEVLGVKNIGKLIPSAEDEKPKDPVSENMNILTGKPVKAFLHQDHQAHITVHMSAIQDPSIAALIGQSPQAQAIQAATAAHIAEHIAFEYRRQLEEQLGATLPEPDSPIPKEVEATMSPLLAQAAQQLLAKNQGEAQQQQAQQQAQDPLVQMQQAELQLKAQEIQLKAEKTKADIAADQVRLQIEQMRIESQERIAGAQIGAKAAESKEKLEAQQMAEGVKMGMKAVTDERNREVQEAQIIANREAQQANRKQAEQSQQPTEE